MELDEVLARRLTTQHLIGAPYADATDAVRHLFAVQSQDAPLARWSLALRCGRPSDEAIRARVDSGAVIRTHVLRPTWHYVAAEDVRWLLDLTGPKVLRSMAARHRQLGLDDPAVLRREVDGLLALLEQQGPLTRREVASAVDRDDLRGERLGHLIMIAELEGLVCSGPLARGQHTYTLLEGRVPVTPAQDHDEAVRELAWRFFAGHGPASLAQLTRWCTVTKREVLAAVADLAGQLVRTEVAGEPHWYAADPPTPPAAASDDAYLFPVFDEAYLSYPGSNFPRLPGHPWGEGDAWFSEAGGGVVVHDRRDVGWWKRKDTARTTTVTLGLAPSLSPAARTAIETEAEALAAFTDRTLDLRRT